MPKDGENSLMYNDNFFFPTEMSIFLKTEKGHFSLLGCIAFSSVVARTEKGFPGKV